MNANELAIRGLGVTAAAVMTECEKYGMHSGCNINCPVLLASNCELQEYDNKELYTEARELGILNND